METTTKTCLECEHCKRIYVNYKTKYVCHNIEVRDLPGTSRHLKMPIIYEARKVDLNEMKTPEWCPRGNDDIE